MIPFLIVTLAPWHPLPGLLSHRLHAVIIAQKKGKKGTNVPRLCCSVVSSSPFAPRHGSHSASNSLHYPELLE